MLEQKGQIMEGKFSDYTLDQVLQVVSIGRQYIEMELSADNDDEYGNIIIKSGQVLSVNLGNLNGFDAFTQFFSTPFIRFRVFLIEALKDIPDPIDSLNNMLENIDKTSSTGAVSPKIKTQSIIEKSEIMKGNFSDYSLEQVLQVISIGRQYISLNLIAESSNDSGNIIIKNNQVLSVKAGQLTNVAAFHHLFKQPLVQFQACLIEPLNNPPVAIGSVSQLLAKVNTNKGNSSLEKKSDKVQTTITERTQTETETETDIMRGDFSDYCLDQVLEVVSIGRQYICLELHSKNSTKPGKIIIKSGKVISVNFGELNKYEAFEKLYNGPLLRFRVYLHNDQDNPPNPVGSIDELLVKVKNPIAKPVATQKADKKEKNIMKGNFADYSLDQILQVVSIGRQYVGVELTAGNDDVYGNMVIKSGQVLSATLGKTSGFKAFNNFFTTPFISFRVFLTEAVNVTKTPIGSLNTLLADIENSAIEKQVKNPTVIDKVEEEILSSAKPPPKNSGVLKFIKKLYQGLFPLRSKTLQTAPPDTKNKSMADELIAGKIEPPQSIATEAEENLAQELNQQIPNIVSDSILRSQAQTEDDSSFSNGDSNPIIEDFSNLENGLVLAIASSKGGVGKTTVSINLSVSLARRGLKTILVDGDPNGDILAAIKVQSKVKGGAYDAIFSGKNVNECLLNTAIPELQILPAIDNPSLIFEHGFSTDLTDSWRSLFNQLLSSDIDIVIVDTSASIYGPTLPILKACTHVIGVLQAETIAYHSFSNFLEFLDSLPEKQHPELAGILLNMLQFSEKDSSDILGSAYQSFPAGKILNTVLQRDITYLHASSTGVPLHFLNKDELPPAASLFDALATELNDRLWEKEKKTANNQPVFFA